MAAAQDYSVLTRLLGYHFTDDKLLREALTHRSASNNNNERLEFLGDGILNFVIAAELFRRYPDVTEGDLSRLRAELVKKEGLAKVARDLSLSDYVILGGGELKSGGYRRDSILADTVEAILGAVYLDAGFEICKNMILRFYTQQLETIPAPSELKDPKTRLQELLQSHKLALPVYDVTYVEGKAHQQTFTLVCRIEELAIETQGIAGSRRKAEQIAATLALALVLPRLKKQGTI
jgi:ribonuclease III